MIVLQVLVPLKHEIVKHLLKQGRSLASRIRPECNERCTVVGRDRGHIGSAAIGRVCRYLTNRERLRRSVDQWAETRTVAGILPPFGAERRFRAKPLQFDHVDSADKINEVSNLLRARCVWSTVKAEIDKCEVRCANCHTRKTAKEIGNWKLKFIGGSSPSASSNIQQ